MKNNKILYIALIPVAVLVLFFLFSEAFHLLTAPSDLSVLGGVLLLVLALFILIKLFIFTAKKLFQ